MLAIAQKASLTSSHLILVITLWTGCFYLDLVDEKAVAQRAWTVCGRSGRECCQTHTQRYSPSLLYTIAVEFYHVPSFGLGTGAAREPWTWPTTPLLGWVRLKLTKWGLGVRGLVVPEVVTGMPKKLLRGSSWPQKEIPNSAWVDGGNSTWILKNKSYSWSKEVGNIPCVLRGRVGSTGKDNNNNNNENFRTL